MAEALFSDVLGDSLKHASSMFKPAALSEAIILNLIPTSHNGGVPWDFSLIIGQCM